ncbi:MAG: SGNH/GDSL hydrolase family protein [Acidimicrobiales bacterium]
MRHRRKRRRGATVIAVVAIVVVATAGVLTRTFLPSVTGASTTGVSGFYLDVGASASLGFQPTGIVHHNGHRTDTGYANDVVALEKAKGVVLKLRQVGCPGETAESMLSMGDHCYTLPSRQLPVAIKFLHQNANAIGLVTIDLGFNDVRPCLNTTTVDMACAQQGITNVRNDLPKVIAQLKAAAGPHVHFVGLEYGDPFLAHYLKGGANITDATQSLQVMTQLDDLLESIYTAAQIPTANIAGQYKSANLTPARLPKIGVVPQNVASVCTMTWMCTPPPWGPDDHPNNDGYRAIADAIVAKLPTTW